MIHEERFRLFLVSSPVILRAMTTVAEVKMAVEKLPPQERLELFRWLAGRSDFTAQQWEALRDDIGVGLAQADRGELAPLDIEGVKQEFRRRLAVERK